MLQFVRDRTESRQQQRERAAFLRVRKTEIQYGRDLRAIARQVGQLISSVGAEKLMGDPAAVANVRNALELYSRAIAPWAAATATRMLADVSRRDQAAWSQFSRMMGRNLRAEIEGAPTGQTLRQLLNEQVGLITSLPREAADRVHRLTTEALTSSARADHIAQEIMRSGDVTASRAALIARTEVGRTASALTQARATHIGATHYVWRTAGDADVRPSHRKMSGKTVAWDDPPTLDGMTGHAGALPNCRCYPEPIVPDEV